MNIKSILYFTLYYCNNLTYISSVNTWASGGSPLAQLVKELDLCLFLCVIQTLWDRLSAEPINNLHGRDASYSLQLSVGNWPPSE